MHGTKLKGTLAKYFISFIHLSLNLPETVSLNKERQLSAKSRENGCIRALSN